MTGSANRWLLGTLAGVAGLMVTARLLCDRDLHLRRFASIAADQTAKRGQARI